MQSKDKSNYTLKMELHKFIRETSVEYLLKKELLWEPNQV